MLTITILCLAIVGIVTGNLSLLILAIVLWLLFSE